MVAAQTLLASNGRCDSCQAPFDLGSATGRDGVTIRTIDDQGPLTPRQSRGDDDWPAALCRDCHHRMRAGSFTSFVDFQFAQHPQCPNCGGRRTKAAMYGMPAYPMQALPWEDQRGCCVMPESWTCGVCGHGW
jgi:hypothetical protein